MAYGEILRKSDAKRRRKRGMLNKDGERDSLEGTENSQVQENRNLTDPDQEQREMFIQPLMYFHNIWTPLQACQCDTCVRKYTESK